jgi:hypothetical protein
MNHSHYRILRLAPLAALLGSPFVALAAPKPAAPAANAALVAALQAVSPDPLGGRLGLVAATARTLDNRTAPAMRSEQTAMIEADRQAYAAWKNTRKS